MRTTTRYSAMVLGGSALILAALLAGFAVELSDNHSNQRRDVATRFRERAQVTAALTSAVFTAAATTTEVQNAQQFGQRRVDPRVVARQASQSADAYVAVLGSRGQILASTKLSPALRARLTSRPPDIAAVVGGNPYGLSDVLHLGPGGSEVIELIWPFQTRYGPRYLLSGIAPGLVAGFIGGYLARSPRTEGGRAYLLDGRGLVLGGSGGSLVPGAPPPERGLAAASGRQPQGTLRSSRYFVSVPIPGSSWRVVLTADNAKLFASVEGANKWVPWALFAAFAAAAVGLLLLLRRVLGSAQEVREAYTRLGVANAELERTNLTLERRALELARSNAELDQFASIASHDLQEPLRKVQTFAGQLSHSEAGHLSEQGQQHLRRITTAAERMQALVQDLLKFSRVSTRARERVPVDLEKVAQEVLADLEAPVLQTGASVNIGSLPTVTGDPLQMRQLLQNLISNGLKFRREGVPPQIGITGRTVDGMAEVFVADNGIGFSPQYGERIFRVFERLHGHGEYQGTGIGLALCRKIAERHGGSVVAESTPGVGSVFTVKLPIEPHPHDAAIEPTAPEPEQAPGRKETPVGTA